MTSHELSSLTPEFKKKNNVLTVCVNVLQRTKYKKPVPERKCPG